MTHKLKLWTSWTQNDRLPLRSPTSARNGSPLCHFSFSLHSQLSLFAHLTRTRKFIPKNLLFSLCPTFQHPFCMIWFLHSLKPANCYSSYLPNTKWNLMWCHVHHKSIPEHLASYFSTLWWLLHRKPWPRRAPCTRSGKKPKISFLWWLLRI